MLEEAMYTFNPTDFQEKFPKPELRRHYSVERSNEKSRSTLPDTPENYIEKKMKKFEINKFVSKNPDLFNIKKNFKIVLN